MTNFAFTKTEPAAASNPSVSQNLMLENNQSTFDIIAVDHLGFGVSNGGYHNVVHFNDQVSSNPTTTSGSGQLFTKTSGGVPDQQLFYQSGTGIICPTNIWACGSFQATDPVVSVNALPYGNVSSITYASGVFSVHFTKALPSNTYIITTSGVGSGNNLSPIVMSQWVGASPAFVRSTTQIDFIFNQGQTLVVAVAGPTTTIGSFMIMGG